MRRVIVPAFFNLTLASTAAFGQDWVDLTPSSGPEPSERGYASAVLDTGRNQIVIFGGLGDGGYVADIWGFSLDSLTWTDLTPGAGSAPLKRRTPASIYDPVGERMVTWSGQAPGVFYNDVWEFDLVGNSWTEFTPTGGPPNIRYGVASTFDPVAGELITFAGFTSLGRFDDVWRFNPVADTWTDVSDTTYHPLKRCLHSASYDSREHRMIMYGGQNSGWLDDIWALDLDTNTWTDITPATRPPGRFFVAHVYDSANHRSTVFGGSTSGGSVNDVWVFDLWTEEWTQLAPSGTPPSAREGAAGVYDTGNDRMIVFGGNDGNYQNDVWALENLSGTLTGAQPVDPTDTSLDQNFPNPFNPVTHIGYSLERPSRVHLGVYNPAGQLVRTLVDGTVGAGNHLTQWDGRNDAAQSVASGVYFYRLETGTASIVRKMVLLK